MNIEVGKYYKLKVDVITHMGAYFDAESDNPKDNILLPHYDMPADLQVGEEREVFIYRDSQDKKIATLKKPFAARGEVAVMTVKEITTVGAFLNWGLGKDLFVPYKEQKYKLEEGKGYPFAVYLDKSDRLCGTTKVYNYLKSDSPYKENDQVRGTVYWISKDLGAMIAVDDKYFGMIPTSKYFVNLKPGDKVEAIVEKVRTDGKLDLSTKEKAHIQMDSDSDLIYKKLKIKGSLSLNDKSSPQLILSKLQMSKKAFKRALGRLLKEGKVVQTETGIELKK